MPRRKQNQHSTQRKLNLKATYNLKNVPQYTQTDGGQKYLGMIGVKSMEKGTSESCLRNPYNHFFTHGVQGLVDFNQFCLVARVKEPTTDSL